MSNVFKIKQFIELKPFSYFTIEEDGKMYVKLADDMYVDARDILFATNKGCYLRKMDYVNYLNL